LLIALVRTQTDRRNGGVRVSLINAIDLPTARCRFGKYLLIPAGNQSPEISNVLRNFPVRWSPNTQENPSPLGLSMRLRLERSGIQVEIQLDSRAVFFPSNEALQNLTQQMQNVTPFIVYD
jgi:DNA polymerase-3 subunit alpha